MFHLASIGNCIHTLLHPLSHNWWQNSQSFTQTTYLTYPQLVTELTAFYTHNMFLLASIGDWIHILLNPQQVLLSLNWLSDWIHILLHPQLVLLSLNQLNNWIHILLHQQQVSLRANQWLNFYPFTFITGFTWHQSMTEFTPFYMHNRFYLASISDRIYILLNTNRF